MIAYKQERKSGRKPQCQPPVTENMWLCIWEQTMYGQWLAGILS